MDHSARVKLADVAGRQKKRLTDAGHNRAALSFTAVGLSPSKQPLTSIIVTCYGFRTRPDLARDTHSLALDC